MENTELNVLDEINKGATMGMDAINFIREKVGDKKFRQVLNTEYDKYQTISQRVNNIYDNYSSKKPHEPNKMEKAMTWYDVQVKTLTDSSNSNISELLLKGTNMGIIEGRRLLNQHKNLSPNIHSLLDEFISMQENSAQILKDYL